MGRTGPWHTGELLAFDLETTGVDPFTDVPVSFALVRTFGGAVTSRECGVVDPGRPIPAPATAVHGITDDRARAEGRALPDAVALVTRVLLDASRDGVPVVGMKVDFDLTMVDACRRRWAGYGLEDGGFVGPVLDALVLDRHFDPFRSGRRSLVDLCANYGVTIERPHDAMADAEATLGVVTAMCDRFPELSDMEAVQLHALQIGWHREWADSLSEWRSRRGLPPLSQQDGRWPIADSRAVGAVVRAAS